MTQIVQQPYCFIQPASTATIYTLEEQNIVLNQDDVKFICEVHIGRTNAVLTSLPVATLKTSPNRAGVGIFDVSPIIEAYVNCSFDGRKGITTQNPNQNSTFKTTPYSDRTPHSIHQIDKFCTNSHNLIWYKLTVGIEYRDDVTGLVKRDPLYNRSTFMKLAWNGVLTNTNPITYRSTDDRYYYDPQDIQYEDNSGDYFIRGQAGSAAGGRFISNMPEQQYIRENDYGTVAFFNCINNAKFQTMPSESNNQIPAITLRFYDENDSTVQTNVYDNVPVNGGKSNECPDKDASAYWIYFGHGLANMKGRGETWPASAKGYEVYVAGEGEHRARRYRFDIIPDSCEGFKAVRLAWQNVLGAWDYYTFNMKSKSMVKSKRKNYQQLGATWNENRWRPKDHLGGQKVFNNVATETLTLNSDYMDEKTAAWLQELFTSSQVYIINDFSSTNPSFAFSTATYIHKYVEPVVIKSGNYTKKTRANDGLIQYNIKVEKSKPLNIQRA
jgi:hypothetical protein